MRSTPLAVSLFAALAMFATTLGTAATVSAQTTEGINIPATAFHLTGNTSYLEAFGVIEAGSAAVVRAPVQFTRPGLQICRLSMWVHDFDADNDVTVNLVRKRLAPDGTAFGVNPETIASASSSGAVDALRRVSTFNVSERAVASGYFYWVELDFEGGPIQVSGVRIDSATSC
jgi:hypothetical protein